MTDQQIANSNYVTLRARPVRTGRSEWLQQWLDGEMPEANVLEQYGFQTGQYYAVVIFRQNNENLNGIQFAALVNNEAARRNIYGPTMAHGTSAVLFHPVEEPRQTNRLKLKTEQIREQLVTRLHGSEVLCGVGRPARGMEDLRRSFFEAEDALRISNKLQARDRTTFFGNSSLFNLLFSLKSPAELQRFCQTWLSDLISYDNDQHSDLLDTLRAYFANNGNTALTAKELKIHRNTLAYRLNRIAEITRLDLDDADVRLNLHLALKAREALTANAV
jgi:PucR family transcriptional regulator, purine catabolism regulatory protein